MPPRKSKKAVSGDAEVVPEEPVVKASTTRKTKNQTNLKEQTTVKHVDVPVEVVEDHAKEKGKKQRRKKKKKTEFFKQNGQQVSDDEVDIEYVAPSIDLNDPTFGEFAQVFARFAPQEKVEEVQDEVMEEVKEEEVQDESEKEEKISKAKLKKLSRMSVAQLKQMVSKPEVVEWVDVTAADPLTLVHLKAQRNSVPVPRHWSQKKKYLQNKRGVIKPPFNLPDYIKATGIMQIRQTGPDVEDDTNLKQKTRARRQPKMGRLDLDYQKMHDAFFKYQTKPKMSTAGDTYYEGREFETNVAHVKPGELSAELRDALNMGPNAPPPWLINQQRYGPPPSYPNLKIPGLNAPIPQGAQWGFHPGGWGRPPVDEWGRGLYGDVFGHGITTQASVYTQHAAHVEKHLWGELDDEEEVSDEESEEEVEEEEEVVAEPVDEPIVQEEEVESDFEPELVELRKDKRIERDEGPKQLYQVIPDRATSISGFMGSERVYDLSKVKAPQAAIPLSGNVPRKRKADEVEVSLNPDAFTEDGLDTDQIVKAYEQKLEEKKAPVVVPGEDLSDLVEEHAKKAAEKRKRQEERRKEGKKKEQFKF